MKARILGAVVAAAATVATCVVAGTSGASATAAPRVDTVAQDVAADGQAQLPNDVADFTAAAVTATHSIGTITASSSSGKIKALQYLLNARGISTTVDGVYGPQTSRNVRTFQSRVGITVDGVAGPVTLGKLISTRQYGSTGSAVKAIQRRLTDNGFATTVDGQFGPGTRSKVIAFQKKFGLTQDGVVGPVTWSWLINPTSSTPPPPPPSGKTPGIDISAYQLSMNFTAEYTRGTRFVIARATAGTSYVDTHFARHTAGARAAGMLTGAYHYARPNASSGATQANFFVNNGGAWKADGKTIPGMVDMEWPPSKSGIPTCWGLSKTAMGNWVASFLSTYKARTGRNALIYTNMNWWKQCVGTRTFPSNPLWVAAYTSTPPATLPGWPATFWQYTSTPYDRDWYFGSLSALRKLASG